MDVEKIMTEGLVFKRGKIEPNQKAGFVKTKAKKSSYKKGTHNSGSAKMKAEYKRRRNQRNKK